MDHKLLELVEWDVCSAEDYVAEPEVRGQLRAKIRQRGWVADELRIDDSYGRHQHHLSTWVDP